MTTFFIIASGEGGKTLAELHGSINDVKSFLNPSHPSSVSIKGTKALDGRGNTFTVRRTE
jgi:hypothetical protein